MYTGSRTFDNVTYKTDKNTIKHHLTDQEKAITVSMSTFKRLEIQGRILALKKRNQE